MMLLTLRKPENKPDKESINDYSLNTSFIYSFDDPYTIKVNFGRKTRFPTLRETFSGALGRFVPNPELKAEEAYNGEVNFIFQNSFSYNYINFFATFMNDGIVRQSLPGSQFQRINKDQIRILGIEAKTNLNIREDLELSANFTYLNAFAKNDDGEFRDTLEYKPEVNAGLTIDYKYNKNINALVEANFIGKEFGLKEGSEYFQQLNDYLILNFRTSYLIPFNDKTNLEFFFRVNNIFDKLYFTQWGLPEAGREFFAGFSLELKIKTVTIN
jgi:iron complex outermembrane receptor protein